MWGTHVRDHDFESQIANLNLEAAKSNERAAEAELRLAAITMHLQPRQLPKETFLNALRGKPKGSAIFLYEDDDPEAFSLAISLQAALKDAGWIVKAPVSIKASGTYIYSPDKMPSILAATGVYGGRGVTLVAKLIEPWPFKQETPFSALSTALSASGFGISESRDDSLPENSFRVVVGRKP